MSIFSNASERQVNLAVLILRAVVGAVFVAHGGQKLFVFGLDGVSAGFAQMGMPIPGLLGPLVAFTEFFGGLAVMAGFLTRPAAIALAFTMLVATLKVHLPNGFFNPGGIEFTLTLFAASLALAITGAGSYAVDSIIGRRVERDDRVQGDWTLRRAA